MYYRYPKKSIYIDENNLFKLISKTSRKRVYHFENMYISLYINIYFGLFFFFFWWKNTKNINVFAHKCSVIIMPAADDNDDECVCNYNIYVGTL